MYTAIILYILEVEGNSIGKRLYLLMARKYIERISIKISKQSINHHYTVRACLYTKTKWLNTQNKTIWHGKTEEGDL